MVFASWYVIGYLYTISQLWNKYNANGWKSKITNLEKHVGSYQLSIIALVIPKGSGRWPIAELVSSKRTEHKQVR